MATQNYSPREQYVMLLRTYFNKYEKPLYDPKFVDEARRKFVKWALSESCLEAMIIEHLRKQHAPLQFPNRTQYIEATDVKENHRGVGQNLYRFPDTYQVAQKTRKRTGLQVSKSHK